MIESLTYRSTSQITDSDRDAILNLWNGHYPQELNYSTRKELDDYLLSLHHSRHLFIEDDQQQVLGWRCTFERRSSEWFVIILDDRIQGKGLGRNLMEDIQSSYASLRGWVLKRNDLKCANGKGYASPAPFYDKLGFQMADEMLEAKGLTFSQIRWP